MPRIRMCRSNPCPNTICCQEKPQVSLGHFWIGFGPEPHRSPEGVPYPVTKVPWSKTRWNIPKYFLSVAVSYPYIHMVVICCSMWGSTSETHWQPESLGCIQTLMPLKIHQFYWGCLRQGGMFFLFWSICSKSSNNKQAKPQAVEAWLHLPGFLHAVLGRGAAKAFADAQIHFWDLSLRETSASQRNDLNSCSLSWQHIFFTLSCKTTSLLELLWAVQIGFCSKCLCRCWLFLERDGDS